MKTLDEVIKAIGCCDDGEYDSDCENCSYAGIRFCCRERKEDALHYLKEYREGKKLYDDIQDYHRKIKEKIETPWHDNPPLTWEELKEMVGKPIWIDSESCPGCWEIIERYRDDSFWKECIETNDSILRFKDQFGDTWNAYRKEKHE